MSASHDAKNLVADLRLKTTLALMYPSPKHNQGETDANLALLSYIAELEAAAPDAPGEGLEQADVRLLVRMIDYLAEGQNEEYGGAKQGASAVEWALGDEMYPEMMAAYRKAAMQAAGAGEETR